MPFAPTQRKIADSSSAPCGRLRREPAGCAALDRPSRGAAGAGVVAMQNGLLHVPTRILHPHTTEFFNQHALPFAFDPKAPPATRWLTFLRGTLAGGRGDDSSPPGSHRVLLGGDTGCRRFSVSWAEARRQGHDCQSRDRTAGPPPCGRADARLLINQFGLSPLIAKPLAIIADARRGSPTTRPPATSRGRVHPAST